MKKEIQISRMINILLKNFIIIICFALVISAVAFFWAGYKYNDLYESHAKLYVSKSNLTFDGNTLIDQSISIHDCIEIAKSEDILQKTSNNLSKQISTEQIEDNLEIKTEPETRVISIKYTDISKARSIEVVKCIKDETIQELDKVLTKERVVIIDNIHTKLIPISTKKTEYAIDGLVVGLLIGIIFVLIRHRDYYTD